MPDAGDLDAAHVADLRARTSARRDGLIGLGAVVRRVRRARRARAASAGRTSSRVGSGSVSRVIDAQRRRRARRRRSRTAPSPCSPGGARGDRGPAPQRAVRRRGATSSIVVGAAVRARRQPAGSGAVRSSASTAADAGTSCRARPRRTGPRGPAARRTSDDAVLARARRPRRRRAPSSDRQHLVGCARRDVVRRVGTGDRFADEPRERRLLAHAARSTGSSTVTRSPRAAMCGSAKMSAAVYAVATGTSCATQRSSTSVAGSVARPLGDDAVDLVAVRGAVGQPS